MSMSTSPVDRSAKPTALILGAGYAGLTAAHEVYRRARGRISVRLVDRHPVHVLRTELYEVGKLAASGTRDAPWLVPIRTVLGSSEIEFVTAEVDGIDLAGRIVRAGGASLPFTYLVIALGSVAAFYHVDGAAEHTHRVYRFSEARRLAEAIRGLEVASARGPPGPGPRIAVVGGGSTGTEVAAEIATADWAKIAAPGSRPPTVVLVCGALPFLAGLPDGLVGHARRILSKAGIAMDEGENVVAVAADHLTLAGGRTLPFDLCVWATGVRAPDAIASLPVDHGRGGRVKVTTTLEIPGHSGVFAIGDCAEIEDPVTHMTVPQTAQAALAEAPVAAANLVARFRARDPSPFVYRERGTIVAAGVGQAAGTVRRVTVWGSPAALLKSLVQKEYAIAVEHGRHPPGL
ncbi:MAG: NAD(P)/FAD-dependent oxidoreductase [Thermoplasmata archaeon]